MSSIQNKQKILLVSPFTFVSGSAVRFHNMALQFAAHGYRVIYSERAVKGVSKPSLGSSIDYNCSIPFNNLFVDILYSTLFNLMLLMKNLDCVAYYALKPAPNNCIPAFIAKLLGKRIILDIDDLDFAYLQPGMKMAISRFFFFLFPRMFGLITCHTQALKSYINQKLRIEQNRIYFLAQGISVEFNRYEPLPFSARIPKSILYIATLGITSDFEDMIAALKHVCGVHPDVLIHIVGDGVRKEIFRQKIEAAGMSDNVSFLGRISHEDAPKIIGSYWIGINYMRPSFVNECRAVLKVREYLAMGLQVVCNDVGDVRQFAHCVYIEKDCDGIAHRLCNLLTQGVDMNKNGAEYVRNTLQWNAIMDDFFRIYAL